MRVSGSGRDVYLRRHLCFLLRQADARYPRAEHVSAEGSPRASARPAQQEVLPGRQPKGGMCLWRAHSAMPRKLAV
eukprot:13389255-Alexandrium_andersonii.AAC.1